MESKLNDLAAKEFYDRAEQKYSNGDLFGAIADLNQTINIQSDYADAYLLRGQIKNETRDVKDMFESSILFEKKYAKKSQYKGLLWLLREWKI